MIWLTVNNQFTLKQVSRVVVRHLLHITTEFVIRRKSSLIINGISTCTFLNKSCHLHTYTAYIHVRVRVSKCIIISMYTYARKWYVTLRYGWIVSLVLLCVLNTILKSRARIPRGAAERTCYTYTGHTLCTPSGPREWVHWPQLEESNC